MGEGKNVRDVKGTPEAPAPGKTTIEPGNIPVLTVQLLDAMNKNLFVLIQQNARIIEILEEK